MWRGPPQGGTQAIVPAVPEPRRGDAARSVSVTSACERELCWFMAVAAVARLLLPKLSIWRVQDRAFWLQGAVAGFTPAGASTGRGLGGTHGPPGSLTWCSVSRLGTSQ